MRTSLPKAQDVAAGTQAGEEVPLDETFDVECQRSRRDGYDPVPFGRFLPTATLGSHQTLSAYSRSEVSDSGSRRTKAPC
jgi:hypothetical protein